MSPKCKTARKGTGHDVPQPEEDPEQQSEAENEQKAIDFPEDDVGNHFQDSSEGSVGCGDLGILAKAQSMVSRISMASRHTMSGHTKRTQMSIEEIVRVRDFGRPNNLGEIQRLDEMYSTSTVLDSGLR
jgi:hypothetical protein